MSDDEYRLPEEVEKDKKPMMIAHDARKMPTKREFQHLFFNLIGLLFFVFIGYKIYGFFSGRQTEKPVEKTVPPVVFAKKSDLEKLGSTLSDVAETVSGLQTKVDALNRTLGEATSSLSQQQLAIEALQASMQAKIKAPPKVVTHHPTHAMYYVQAIVPGRAWLRGPRGTPLTVKVGDDLPGYGTIQSVDPGLGIVTTSSGETIQYNPQEN